MLWFLALWVASALGGIGFAAWHQVTAHTGSYDYCLAWTFSLAAGFVAAGVWTSQREALAPSASRFPWLARFCAGGAGLCVLGIGGLLVFVLVTFMFPAWFSSPEARVRRSLFLLLMLGLFGILGVAWGFSLLAEAFKGARTPQALPRPSPHS